MPGLAFLPNRTIYVWPSVYQKALQFYKLRKNTIGMILSTFVHTVWKQGRNYFIKDNSIPWIK